MKPALKSILKIFLLGVIGVLLQTCKDDKIECQECRDSSNYCDSFPKPTGIFNGIITVKDTQRLAPCFNPVDNNEFIYILVEGNKHKLIKFNLETNNETLLNENTRINGQPKWGQNGKIVFTKSDNNIYLVKSNGDSSKKLTNYFWNSYPSFLGEDKVFFSVMVETVKGASGNKVIDLFGNRLDSIRSSDLGAAFGINDINSNGIIASWFCQNSICSIMYFNFDSKNYQSAYVFPSTGRNAITGIAWHPNNEDIYFSTFREGLFRVNINSKKVVKIRNGCDTRSYRYLNISPDGKKIIVERVDATDYTRNPGSWTEEAKIYIMDLDGKNERNVFE
jgi:Tol biopolymer transport system component